MARNELRFGILGPLEISAGFRSLPLGTPKQRAVLATLIIHRNRPVGIDSLIDAAWEQDRPEGSRATVCKYFSNWGLLISTTGRGLHHIVSIDPPRGSPPPA
ncbi:regulator, partial [Mycobacterium tuberculosis]